MGVDTGYTQGDVIEFAKALTGWTVGGPQTARAQAMAGAGFGPHRRRPAQAGAHRRRRALARRARR